LLNPFIDNTFFKWLFYKLKQPLFLLVEQKIATKDTVENQQLLKISNLYFI